MVNFIDWIKLTRLREVLLNQYFRVCQWRCLVLTMHAVRLRSQSSILTSLGVLQQPHINSFCFFFFLIITITPGAPVEHHQAMSLLSCLPISCQAKSRLSDVTLATPYPAPPSAHRLCESPTFVVRPPSSKSLVPCLLSFLNLTF